MGGHTLESGVGAEDSRVLFRVWLPKGQHKLQSWFYDAEGNARGAYYVYVTRDENKVP